MGILMRLFVGLLSGNVDEAEAMERALAPLLDEGMLQHLLDLLRLLRLLRARGAAVVAPWEVLVSTGLCCAALHADNVNILCPVHATSVQVMSGWHL